MVMERDRMGYSGRRLPGGDAEYPGVNSVLDVSSIRHLGGSGLAGAFGRNFESGWIVPRAVIPRIVREEVGAAAVSGVE